MKANAALKQYWIWIKCKTFDYEVRLIEMQNKCLI